MRRSVVIGQTALGRPIEAFHFVPPSYAKPRDPAVLFGAIHGDEAVSGFMLDRLIEDLIERPPGRDTWVIPVLNVDGTLAGTKDNARGVDLNRNFASANWTAQHKAGYHPGDTAESEPETRTLVDLIERVGARRLIACHATYRVMNWDGAGEELATEMARLSNYPVSGDIGYPTPGSFGSKYGVDRGLEVVTIEVPYLVIDERGWTDVRAALRWSVDLPT